MGDAVAKSHGVPSISLLVSLPPYFDLKQHLREWHRFVLPLFVVIAAISMVLFLVIRTKENGSRARSEEATMARLGLLAPGPRAVFDPAFAVLSPMEMVLAPTSGQFDFPIGTEHGLLADEGIDSSGGSRKQPVYAVAAGFVLLAGQRTSHEGNQVILLHERPDGKMIGSVYGPLSSVRVPAGGLVRRGEIVGTTMGDAGNGDRFPFALSRITSSQGGEPLRDSIISFLTQSRGRPDDHLSAAPEGAPVEPSAFNLEVDGVSK